MAHLIELSDRTGLDYLRDFVNRGQNLSPILGKVGFDLAESSMQRFNTATSPDGQPWAPNSALTLARYSRLFAKNADGSLKKASVARLANKKPGTGETGLLKSTVSYQVPAEDTVSIGSSLPYAGTFHYGAKSGEFGFGMYATRQGSFPIPWGNIPARPFLGLSSADKINVAELIRSYMLEGLA